MGLARKIEWLNKQCEDTLSITKYVKWDISSFGQDTYLSIDKCLPSPQGNTIEVAVDRAMTVVIKKIREELRK